jgi:hypothetical protein
MKEHHMIPFTDERLTVMLVACLQVLHERGVITSGRDEKETAERLMEFIRAHGAMDRDGEQVYFGRCILLPPTGRGLSLLLITPCPADEYDEALARKPSPVLFERTENDEIIVPGRWLVTKLEELSMNAAATAELRVLALDLSRRSHVPRIVLPPQAETVAIKVAETDGTERVFEALPGGLVISLDSED